MTDQEARELLSKMVNELQVERGVKRTDIEIKINPGFKTRVITNTFNSTALIEIENINDIQYLSVIPIYLDTFVRLTQDKSSSGVSVTTIQQLCGSKQYEEVQSEDIIASSEVVFPEQEEKDDLEDDEENSYSDNKSKNILDLLFEEDEEEEDSNELVGGADSSSLSQISSSPSSGPLNFNDILMP
jgi:hypothetical protein